MDKMCTVYKTMDYLSKRWTVLILHEMSKGAEWKRFSEIERSMKEVTAKVLTERLRELEAEGLVERRVDTSCVPIKSEYRLTEASRELMCVIHELKSWALKWKIDNPVCASTQCRLCTLRSLDQAVQEQYQVFEPGLVQKVDVVVAVFSGGYQPGVLHLADGRAGRSVVEPEEPFRKRGPGFLLGEPSDDGEDVLVCESLEYLVLWIVRYR